MLALINKREIQVLAGLYSVKQWLAKGQMMIKLNWFVQLLNIYSVILTAGCCAKCCGEKNNQEDNSYRQEILNLLKKLRHI